MRATLRIAARIVLVAAHHAGLVGPLEQRDAPRPAASITFAKAEKIEKHSAAGC